MTKNEMATKMQDICFKVHGVGLQLSAGHMLRAAAATTVEERVKQLEAARLVVASSVDLATLGGKIVVIHPEYLEGDELSKPFNELENMTEEEIAEWIMAQIKLAKEGMTE